MAVIYVPQDPREAMIGQALGGFAQQFLGTYAKAKMQQDVLKRFMEAQGMGDQQQQPSQRQQQDQQKQTDPKEASFGPSGDPSWQIMAENTMGPGAGEAKQQFVTPDMLAPDSKAAANKVATVQAGAVTDPSDPMAALGPPPTPPNIAKLTAAVGFDPTGLGKQLIAGSIKQYGMQRQAWEDRRRDLQFEKTTQLGEKRLQLAYDKLKDEREQRGITNARADKELQLRENADARGQAKEDRESAAFPLMMQKNRTAIAKDSEQLKQLRQEQATVWTPDEVQKAADNFAAGGFQHPPNFGLGRGASAVNRNNFWKAVNNLPMTPEQRRQSIMRFSLDHQAVQTAGRQFGNLTVQINKADQLMKPLDQEFAKLEPILGNAKMWNRFKQAILNNTGDPAFSKADIYVHSMLTAYAKSLNPNGVPTDAFRGMVSSWLDTVSSPKQLKAKLEAIRTDMGLEQQALVAGASQVTGGSQNWGLLQQGGEGGGSTGSDAGGGSDDPFNILGQ